MFSIEEEFLYSRQLSLEEIGKKGQQKIKAASVLVLGCGGLGSLAGYYLAALGVGHLGLVDYDRVELSNLSRQIMYNIKDINSFKSKTAHQKLADLNPFIKISSYQVLPDEDLLNKLINQFDCVVDCLDNTAAKLLANKVCYEQKKLFVHAGIRGWSGQLAIFDYQKNQPCLNCLLTSKQIMEEADCLSAGVLGPICGVISSMQVLAVLKYILNIKLSSNLILVDGKDMVFTSILLKQNPQCKTCG